MKTDCDELIYRNGMFYSSADEGPFCPSCYLENSSQKNLMLKKDDSPTEQIVYECSHEDCNTSVFP